MHAISEWPFGQGSVGPCVRTASVCSRFAVRPARVGSIGVFAGRCAALIGWSAGAAARLWDVDASRRPCRGKTPPHGSGEDEREMARRRAGSE